MTKNSEHEIEQLQQRVTELENQLNSLSADTANLRLFLKRILLTMHKTKSTELATFLLIEVEGL